MLCYRCPVQKILPWASKFEPAMHFLFSQLQDLWSYAEVIGPPGVEDVDLLRCSHSDYPAPFVEETVISPVYISGFIGFCVVFVLFWHFWLIGFSLLGAFLFVLIFVVCFCFLRTRKQKNIKLAGQGGVKDL